MAIFLVVLAASVGGFGGRVRKDTFDVSRLGRIVPVRYSRPAPGVDFDVDVDVDVDADRWLVAPSADRGTYTVGSFVPLRF